jgi:hypothetical protein
VLGLIRFISLDSGILQVGDSVLQSWCLFWPNPLIGLGSSLLVLTLNRVDRVGNGKLLIRKQSLPLEEVARLSLVIAGFGQRVQEVRRGEQQRS